MEYFFFKIFNNSAKRCHVAFFKSKMTFFIYLLSQVFGGISTFIGEKSQNFENKWKISIASQLKKS